MMMPAAAALAAAPEKVPFAPGWSIRLPAWEIAGEESVDTAKTKGAAICQIRMTRKGEELPTAVLACRSGLPMKAHLAALAERLNFKTGHRGDDYHGGKPSQDHAVSAPDGRKGLARTIAVDGGSLALVAIWNRPASKASAMAVVDSLRRESAAQAPRPRLSSSGGIGFSAYDPGSGAGSQRAPTVSVAPVGLDQPASGGGSGASSSGGGGSALDSVRGGPPRISSAAAGPAGSREERAIPPEAMEFLKNIPGAGR
jgi:hypothetical protein